MPTDHPAAIDPSLAVLFFVNAEAIAGHLPPAAPEEVAAVGEALHRWPRERLPDLLAEVVPLLLTAAPALSATLDAVRRRQPVRSAGAGDLGPVIDFVVDHIGTLAVIIGALRLLGDNRIKAGGVEIKTGSVLRDFAGLIKSWKE